MPAGQDGIEQLLNKLWCEGQGNVESVVSTAGASAVNQISDSALFSVTAITLSAATPVVKLPLPAVGKKKVLYLIQDATGSRVASWSTLGAGAVKWVGAAAPTLTTAAASVDKVTFECFDGTNWVGQAALHIA